MSKTYILVDEQNPLSVKGYITLTCSEIKLEESQKPFDCNEATRYSDFPAIKIARLAVDRRLQGKGFGTKLVDHALAIIKVHVMPPVGCRYVIIDAKSNAIEFYQKKFGFIFLNEKTSDENDTVLMFIDLYSIPLPENLISATSEKSTIEI